MRIVAIGAVAAGLGLLATAPGFAQGMVHGVKHGATTKARCSPGDANVLVNMKSKTYVMDDAKNRAAMKSSASMSAIKSMCKSEAESMGARMSSSAVRKKSG